MCEMVLKWICMNSEILKKYMTISKVESKKGKKPNLDYSKVEVLAISENGQDDWRGSISQAVDFLLRRAKNKNAKVAPSSIFKCACGQYPNVQNFVWKFAKEEDKLKYNIFFNEERRRSFIELENNGKPIVVFDVNGNPINVFANIFEALLWLKENGENVHEDRSHDYRAILNACKDKGNKIATSAGYQWRFEEDVLIKS